MFSCRHLFFPLSIIFEMLTTLRRRAFQKRWLAVENFTVPTICVGNLRVGGTGKTPHVEYIAKILSQNYHVAILSRGYGRKTKGYISAHEIQNRNSKVIGDEPMQYVTKFSNVEVAVCEKRKIGIQKLLHTYPNLEFIILDDAFQHLSVNYSLKILLTEYERPFFEDFPLPVGDLRECRNASKYADIIIVTKCPENLTPEEKTAFIQKLKLQQHQELFFTKINYKSEHLHSPSSILLITGIANPAPLVQYLENQYEKIHTLHFPDHHIFTKNDINKIITLKKKLGGENCTIITTEKDAVRLQDFENMPVFDTIPIEIIFLENETIFKEKLLSLLKQYDA